MRRVWCGAVLAGLFLAGVSAVAENYDLKRMTPAVQQALDGRKARYEELAAFKQQGLVGEDRQGLVKALKPENEMSRLVEAENADRETIYRAIVDQNGLGADGLAEVKRAFAEVQRERARPGEPIQLPSGEWVRK